jgi:hypothetical protein
MVVVCSAIFGIIFLLYTFITKQVAKQTDKHKEKINFIRSLINFIAENLKK